MFCPNCGNDCGDAKFCQNCGKEVRTGIINLQSNNGEGSALAQGQDIVSHKYSLRKCHGVYGYLALGADALTIEKTIPFGGTTHLTIPYVYIKDVYFLQAIPNQSAGLISIRYQGGENRLVTDLREALYDDTAITFGSDQNEAFSRVYHFVNNIVETNRSIRQKLIKQPNLPPEVLQMAQAKHDLDYYFKGYYPDRGAAIAALRDDTELSVKQAKMVADYVFDILGSEIQDEMETQLNRSGRVYCPRCLSTNVTGSKRGFDYMRGSIGAGFSLSTGLLLGGAGADDLECMCLKCGYKWQPK